MISSCTRFPHQEGQDGKEFHDQVCEETEGEWGDSCWTHPLHPIPRSARVILMATTVQPWDLKPYQWGDTHNWTTILSPTALPSSIEHAPEPPCFSGDEQEFIQ